VEHHHSGLVFKLTLYNLQSEVTSLKEELTMYQNALKYGYGDQTTQTFKGEEVVRNLNSENWATPKTHLQGYVNKLFQSNNGKGLGLTMNFVCSI